MLTAIDLFCGAGGLSLGLINAGFNVLAHIDNDKNAVATIKHNLPDSNVICKDIKYTEYKSSVPLDLLAAGFPCQPFSFAGQGKGFHDARGTLFWEVGRYINDLKPKVVLLENVRGIISHDKGKTLKVIIGALDELGYVTEYRLLNAVNYEVPQKRERVVIIATRKELGIPIKFPVPCPNIITLDMALRNVPQSKGTEYSENKRKVLELIPEGGCWRDLPEDVKKSYMGKAYYSTGGRTGMARRLSWNEPSLTLTCSPAQKQTERCHPSETRPLTVREYARIQTFPDNYEFCGSVSSQYKQIGNAVPVKLAEHIGNTIKEMLQ